MKKTIIALHMLSLIFIFSGILFIVLFLNPSIYESPTISFKDEGRSQMNGTIEFIDQEENFMIISRNDPEIDDINRKVAIRINFFDSTLFEEQRPLSKDNIYYGLTDPVKLSATELRTGETVSVKYGRSGTGFDAVYVLRGNLFLK